VVSEGDLEANKMWILWATLIILIPISSLFESMKELSIISIISLISIVTSLFYILITDIQLIKWGSVLSIENYFIDFSGLPSFFGVALFMFEGNALALEINH
jgi:hypothetical protein